MRRRRLGTLVLCTALVCAGCGPALEVAPDRVATTQRAATAIEYGLIAALVAVVIIGALTELGEELTETFDAVADAINDANDAAQDQAPMTCVEACGGVLEAALAQCTDAPCADAALAAHDRCVAACPGKGPPSGRWPMIALQMNADARLSVAREDSFARTTRFIVPAQIDVAYGDPGTGTAALSWLPPRGRPVRCTYAADVDRYVLRSCSNQQPAGSLFYARSVRLSVGPGLRDFPVTAVSLDLVRR